MRSVVGSEEDLPAITADEKAFVEALVGPAKFDTTAAARIAGYPNPDTAGSVLLRKESILEHVTAAVKDKPELQAAMTKQIRKLAGR